MTRRVDEITQAGFQDLIIGHRPDKNQPVDGNQAARKQQAKDDFAGQHHPTPETGTIAQEQYGNQQGNRPDDAMDNDLDGRNIGQPFEVDRCQSPENEGAQRSNHAQAMVHFVIRKWVCHSYCATTGSRTMLLAFPG